MSIQRSDQKKPNPGAGEWRPTGTSYLLAGKITLSHDEYGAIHLVDLDGIDPSRAAEIFHVTPQRFSSLLKGARRKIADAMAHGKVITVDGAESRAGEARYRCGTCGNVWSELEPIDLEDTVCPRCGGTRIIDLSTIGGSAPGYYRR